MWAANLGQVFRVDPGEKPYAAWVLFVRLKSDSKKEFAVREKHEHINVNLAEQGVNYTEITTRPGQQEVYDKFGFRKGKHPLFFVLSKHPLDYDKDDSLLVVEWGKWSDVEQLKDDLMAFVNSFSEVSFREAVATSKDVSKWERAGKFIEKHVATIVKVGATVATALL